MLFFLFYNVLLLLLSPVVLISLYWPKKGKLSFGSRWPEHLGLIKRSKRGYDIWFHAVSVGECNAAVPMIKKLQLEQANLNILVTTTTATGYQRIAEQLANTVTHQYYPLDFLPCVWLFLNRTKPKLLVIMETELWPNMLQSCKQRHIPVLLANARMSARSAKRYGKFTGISQWFFSRLSAVYAQFQSDADRFIELGVAQNKVQITGSVKFDFEAGADVQIQAQELRQKLGIHRPIIIAASTRDNEESLVLEAFQGLLQSNPDTLLILVPRHPQRFEQVNTLCKHSGFETITRSSQAFPSKTTHIYLGDTMGELPLLYAASDIAFIGGSLVPLGGQNMLEPASLGKPCLMGPSIFNFTDVANELIKHKALKICEDQNELAHCFKRLLSEEALRIEMGRAARQIVSQNRGAVDKTLTLLKPWLVKR